MRKDERGQALVETALLIPVMLFIMAGIFDFGRVFYYSIHMQLAAQETVRLGGLGQTEAEMETFARDYFQGENTQLTISVTADNGRRSGEYITVHFDYSVDLVTPVLSTILSGNIPLSADSTIRIE